MMSTLTGRRDPQGAQEGVHGIDGVDQAIRDADEGGVVRSGSPWSAAWSGRSAASVQAAGRCERERQAASLSSRVPWRVRPAAAPRRHRARRDPWASGQREARVQRELGMGQPTYRRYRGLSDRMGQGRMRGFVGQPGRGRLSVTACTAGGDLESAQPGRATWLGCASSRSSAVAYAACVSRSRANFSLARPPSHVGQTT